MDDDKISKVEVSDANNRGFLASILIGLVRDFVKLIIAFAVGTGAGAVVCWYYGIPIGFSILGGILVLALALVFTTDGLFS